MYLERLLSSAREPSDTQALRKANVTARDVVCQVNLEMEQFARMYELEAILAKSYIGRPISSLGKVLREDVLGHSMCEDDGGTFTPMKDATVFVFEEAVVIGRMDAKPKKKRGSMKERRGTGTWLASIDLVQRGWQIEPPTDEMIEAEVVEPDPIRGPLVVESSWCVHVRTDNSTHKTHVFAAASSDTKAAWTTLVDGDNWWEIPLDQLKVGALLSRGAFSAAFEGSLAGKPVCIKKWNDGSAGKNAGGGGKGIKGRRLSARTSIKGGQSQEDRQAEIVELFAEEAKAMEIQQVHPNLLRLYGVCHQGEKRPLWLVTELEVNGSLHHFCLSDKGVKLTDMHVLGLLAEAAAGVEALHEWGIIHRNLRSDNMLIGEARSNGTFPLKIGGFRRAVQVAASYSVDVPTPVGLSFRMKGNEATGEVYGCEITRTVLLP
jgi:hypothetical protein